MEKQHCVSAFSFLILITSCSNELDEALQPVNKSSLQFVVSDFPTFGEGTQTRVIGTQDKGKTAWENGDQILVTLTSQKYGEQAAALIYDGSSWSTEVEIWVFNDDGFFKILGCEAGKALKSVERAIILGSIEMESVGSPSEIARRDAW